MNRDDKIPELKEFSIMTHDQFRRAKLASLSKETRVEWRRAGSLPVDDSGLLVSDWFPITNTEIDTLRSPPNIEAQVLLETLSAPERQTYVSAIKIILEDIRVTDQQELKFVTAVDSGHMLIANADRLRSAWRVGGEHNETDILVRIFDGELGDAGQRALVAFRRIEGVDLEQIDADCYQFIGSMNDDEIAASRKIVAESNGVARILIRDDSMQFMRAQLKDSHVATYCDCISKTCAFMFQAGFGDGGYAWRALFHEDRLVGYFCDLIGGNVVDRT